jgi:hypothetical protein
MLIVGDHDTGRLVRAGKTADKGSLSGFFDRRPDRCQAMSTDPLFLDKLNDVVDLDHDPPPCTRWRSRGPR